MGRDQYQRGTIKVKRKRRKKVRFKKRFYVFVSLFILLIGFLISRFIPDDEAVVVANEKPLEDLFTVVIDPGHGGYDGGTENKELGIFEKDIALDISLQVGQKLEDKGIKVIYTRTEDYIPWKKQPESLKGRSEISNNSNADLFVSIHGNYYEKSPLIRGMEVWCRFKDTEDERLAQSIVNNVGRLDFTEIRGLKYEDEKELYVLKNTEATSVLIELGYLSNPEDVKTLTSQEGKEKYVQAISEAIVEFKEKNFKLKNKE
ncbi:N-acetylmuramoyl-L-alanine amidase family protein [Dethiothermospora halolimnae]|uniref:N-acetylmuramoyl-L-alanine amidase family protein n=1 Tax=Dethiothermospora halolimnae TaxID=3114390 RepID=UPI003CCBFEF9